MLSQIITVIISFVPSISFNSLIKILKLLYLKENQIILQTYIWCLTFKILIFLMEIYMHKGFGYDLLIVSLIVKTIS